MSSLSTRVSYTKSEATSTNGMVATKHHLATEAGLEMLRLGGNAMDAGVSACFAVGVVEPESSGIGGGGYMVFQMQDRGGVIGFPMKGPVGANPDMYQLTGRKSVGTFGWPEVYNDENIHGYKSIAVPGTVAGLIEAHKRFGTLPLREVVEPAICLARKGFIPGWFTLYKFANLTAMLKRYRELGNIFMPNNNLPFGNLDSPHTLRQPDLADALESIAKDGSDAFYLGDIAAAIVNDIQANDGILTRKDLEEYRVLSWEDGLQCSYRDKTIRVPPYACAGITTAMTLKLWEHTGLSSYNHNSTDMLHRYISCARLAHADRFEYLGDPRFVDAPWNGLMSKEYTHRRQLEIDKDNIPIFKPGNPWIEEGRDPQTTFHSSSPQPDNGTTHLAVIDNNGNAVSITNTIMSGFGSGIVPKGTGIIMNNGMMWYDPVPGRINSILPGKYPLNNMTPALVLGTDGVEIAVGASGGRRITNCVSSLIINMVDYNMGPQEAIDAPRVDCSTSSTDVDARLDGETIVQLRNKGHTIRPVGEAFTQTGFSSFASPVAITRKKSSLKAGVDTFHSAHAAGL